MTSPVATSLPTAVYVEDQPAISAVEEWNDFRARTVQVLDLIEVLRDMQSNEVEFGLWARHGNVFFAIDCLLGQSSIPQESHGRADKYTCCKIEQST